MSAKTANYKKKVPPLLILAKFFFDFVGELNGVDLKLKVRQIYSLCTVLSHGAIFYKCASASKHEAETHITYIHVIQFLLLLL